MAQDRRTLRALAALLPAGTLGLSVSLAAADAKATAVADGNARDPGSVAERLQSIRDSVSGALSEVPNGDEPFLKVDPEKRLAWWGNGWHNGWHNGGWGNGWHNGGWGNRWHKRGWGHCGPGNGAPPLPLRAPPGDAWPNALPNPCVREP